MALLSRDWPLFAAGNAMADPERNERCCLRCLETKKLSEFYSMQEVGQRKRWHTECKKCVSDIRKHKRRTDPAYREKDRIRLCQSRSRHDIRIVAMFNALKNRAKKHDISFIISKSDIQALAEAQNWTCAKTGLSLDLTSGEGQRPFGPTIDRIDNSRGYEPDNIQLVCYIYNMAKNRFTDADVFAFSEALLEYGQQFSHKVTRAA